MQQSKKLSGIRNFVTKGLFYTFVLMIKWVLEYVALKTLIAYELHLFLIRISLRTVFNYTLFNNFEQIDY